MKIYFAGPLFTPYVRRFISDHAQILRDHGIDPFVPHESFTPEFAPETFAHLIQRGLLTAGQADAAERHHHVQELIRQGRVKREEVGVAPLSPERIFDVDYGGLAGANAVLAILDGSQVDDGTACEIGIFYTLSRTDPTKKGIIGLMTDSRSIRKVDHYYGVNFFVLGVIEEVGRVVHSFDEALAQLKAWQAELQSTQ